MASSSEYLEYVLDLLGGVDGIEYRKMMGEYMLGLKHQSDEEIRRVCHD